MPPPPALPSSLAVPSSLLHPFNLHLQSVDRHHRPRSSWLRQPTHLAIMTKVTEARPPSEPQTLMSAHFHMESNLHLHLHPGSNPIPTLSPTPACSWLSILPHTRTKPKRFCLALLDPHPKREEKRPCWSLHILCHKTGPGLSCEPGSCPASDLSHCQPSSTDSIIVWASPTIWGPTEIHHGHLPKVSASWGSFSLQPA